MTQPKSDLIQAVQSAVANQRAAAANVAKRATAINARRRPGLSRALATAQLDKSAAGKTQVAAITAMLADLDASTTAMRIVTAQARADAPVVTTDTFAIAGVVVDKTGAPLAGIHVAASVAGAQVATACTNPSGSFQLTIPAPVEKQADASTDAKTVNLRATTADHSGVLYDGSKTPYAVVAGGLQQVTLSVDLAAAYPC